MTKSIGIMENNPAREDVFFCTAEIVVISTFFGSRQLHITATRIKYRAEEKYNITFSNERSFVHARNVNEMAASNMRKGKISVPKIFI
jgi:hypothetical protein